MIEALRVENVSLRYGDLVALDSVSFAVRPGEMVSLVGPSGCGKSSLLRIIAGLETRHSGRVHVPVPPGVVFQEPRLLPWLTVAENIAFGLRGRGAADPRVRAVARQVGLEQFLGALPRQLSGGMAQRAAIARALVSRPGLLLLDEPFSAVDAFTRMHLQDLLLQVAREHGTTLVLVTHDVDEALYLGDRVLVLAPRPGRLRAEIPVRLSRPRDRRHPALAGLRADVLTTLYHGGDAAPPAAAAGYV